VTTKIVILKPVPPSFTTHGGGPSMGVAVGPTTPRVKKIFVKKQLTMPRMNNRLTDLTIGTWYVRSLFRTGALTTVLSDLNRYRLAITAIKEVRWTSTGHLKTEKYTVFYSGGTKHERGVGFIVNDQVLQNVKRFEAINDRICYLEIQ